MSKTDLKQWTAESKLERKLLTELLAALAEQAGEAAAKFIIHSPPRLPEKL